MAPGRNADESGSILSSGRGFIPSLERPDWPEDFLSFLFSVYLGFLPRDRAATE